MSAVLEARSLYRFFHAGDDETLAHATTEKSAAREKSAKEAERVGFTLAAGSG